MGPVSVCFVTENANFQKERFKRMEAVVREKESEKVDNVKPNGKEKEPTSGDSDQQKRNQNSEDGEISDDESQSDTRKGSRGSCSRNEASSSRRRSSSRSPVTAKRKRSPSANRHYLPKRPNDRGDPRRSRMPRSPAKPFQYRNNNSQFHFNNRSGRRWIKNLYDQIMKFVE